MLAALGFLIMMPSLALMLLGNMTRVPFLVVSEVMVCASLLLFAVIVFRATGGKHAAIAA